MHPIYPTIRKTHCQHPKQTLAVFDDALMVLARCMRRWCRANAKARKKTDLRHKARGKPCGNPHLEHWMQHESTHVTESWRVWSQGSVMLFCRIQYFFPRSKEDWYQSEARQACETEDDLACSELNIFYQYAIEVHRMYIVLYYI